MTPDVWKVKPGTPTKIGAKTWDVYHGSEHMGTEFLSREEAEDFMREFLPEGWSTDWPTAPGWYWFWDPSFPDTVEPGQMRLAGGANQYLFYVRASEIIYERDFPGCHWHVMEKPPAAPKEEGKGEGEK